MTELETVLLELRAMRTQVEEMLSQRSERPKLYKYEEAARLLSVDPKTISRMVACGELLNVNVRGKKIPAEEIDRLSTPAQRPGLRTEKRPRFDPDKFRAEVKKARGV